MECCIESIEPIPVLRLPIRSSNSSPLSNSPPLSFTSSSENSECEFDSNSTVEVIAQGGSGTIRRVSRLDQVVAKVLSLSPDDTLFQNEVKMMKAVSPCENIVTFIGAEASHGVGVIYMKWYKRGDLRALLEEDSTTVKGGLAEDLVCSYMAQIFTALNICHDARIIHGDVKPENILIDGDEEITLVLADFGAARTYEPGEDHKTPPLPDQFRATLAYLAPEGLVFSTTSVKTDVWAAGITMYQLLTGKLPEPVRHLTGRSPRDPLRSMFEQSTWTDLITPLRDSFSSECCDILQDLLQTDPLMRSSSSNVLKRLVGSKVLP